MTVALDGGEWSASRPDRGNAGVHCTGGWVGLRAGLNTEARGKILCLCWGSNLDRSVVQSVVRCCYSNDLNIAVSNYNEIEM
jgi:hypothetical protein